MPLPLARPVDAPLPALAWTGRLLRPGVAMLSALLLGVLVLTALVQPPPAWAVAPEAERLFENTCAGCHPHGGNIIRRGQTLRLDALQRRGLASQTAIAAVVADGLGQMGGYGTVLGDEGVRSVAEWVWQQAQAGWPRHRVGAALEGGNQNA